jgi:hypothetical protein
VDFWSNRASPIWFCEHHAHGPAKFWSPAQFSFFDSIDPKRASPGFQMAEVATQRHLFADILRLITELRPPPDPSPA